jgi:hypothetical protein
MSRGGEVGAHMASAGLGGAPAPSGTIVGDHASRVDASIAADEARRRETIAMHQASIEKHRRMADDAANHPHSKSAVEQARSVGYGIGSTAAGLVGAPGVLADLAGWFAANNAEEAVQLSQKLVGIAHEMSEKAEKHRVEQSVSARGFMGKSRLEA